MRLNILSAKVGRTLTTNSFLLGDMALAIITTPNRTTELPPGIAIGMVRILLVLCSDLCLLDAQASAPTQLRLLNNGIERADSAIAGNCFTTSLHLVLRNFDAHLNALGLSSMVMAPASGPTPSSAHWA